ncbi:MAG: bifunctional adenosylcobinamide kinase/adenosylcobinamide-phosphate guanylyltransferase [Paracoccaceae bacterium]
MSGKITFVLGGAASGKSAYAEGLCTKPHMQRHYIATAQVHDDEMRTKVDKHVEQRGDGWVTHEEAFDLETVLSDLTTDDICLLDCATMWLTNHMLADHDLSVEQSRFMDSIGSCKAELIIVSNETGQGIVPENALARKFRDAQGRLNILLAQEADCVVQVIAGLPNVLKGKLT